MSEYRISHFEQQWRSEPQSRVFLRLAEEYRKSGAFDKAVEVCLSGIEHHPGYLPALVCLGRCLHHLERLEEAENWFRKVLQIAPDNSHALRGLGLILQQTGRGGEAIEYLEIQALQEPGDEQVAEALRLARESAVLEEDEPEPLELDDDLDQDIGNEAVAISELDLGDEDDLLEVSDDDIDPLEEEADFIEPVESVDPTEDIEPIEEIEPIESVDESDVLASIESDDSSEDVPESAPEPVDIDEEFERRLQDPADDGLFEEQPEEEQTTRGPATGEIDGESLIRKGMKHEHMTHFETALEIYSRVDAAGDDRAAQHLARLRQIMAEEQPKQKKIRLLSNLLDKIKGVYHVQ